MTGRMSGWVGDSPIIGAGTYAHNSACAVSATGHGELFMSYAVAVEIAVCHASLSLDEAAGAVIEESGKFGGRGGVIAVGRTGAPVLPFNTAGMYRGFLQADGKIFTAIWSEPYQEW